MPRPLAVLPLIDDEQFFAAAPSPFREVYALDAQLGDATTDSVVNQMRFLAAMAGPARLFSTQLGVFGTATRHVPAGPVTDIRNFLRETLQANPPGFFLLTIEGNRANISVHGEHNQDIGKALYFVSEEFRSALTLAYERDLQQGDHQMLRGLFRVINNWCFDGSINQLNQFLQEHDLAGDNLALVPNFDGKLTAEQKAAEYARAFALHQDAAFLRETGSPSRSADGGYAEGFAERYLNAERFAHYLQTHEAASMLCAEEREDVAHHVTDTLRLF